MHWVDNDAREGENVAWLHTCNSMNHKAPAMMHTHAHRRCFVPVGLVFMSFISVLHLEKLRSTKSGELQGGLR